MAYSYRRHDPGGDSYPRSQYGRNRVNTMQQLTEQIERVYQAKKEKFDSISEKEDWRRQIERVIRGLYSNAQLILMGSSVTGFNTQGSDSDLCLWMGPAVRMRNWACESEVTILSKIDTELKKWGKLETKLISGARVPVLILSKYSYEADISINNRNGLCNTYLLMCYNRLDPRVTQLGVVVKAWAEKARITNAKEHKLSGFALALLVIHYLQVGCYPPVIPSLHKDYPQWFNAPDMEDIVETILDKNLPYIVTNYRSSNTQSLGELLLGFFKFYSSFTWSKVISIKSSSVSKYGGQWRNPHIKIEDPSDGNNVARALWKPGPFQDIKGQLSAAYRDLQRTGYLETFI